MSEITELERKQSLHIRELETMLESCEIELTRAKDKIAELEGELAKARQMQGLSVVR